MDGLVALLSPRISPAVYTVRKVLADFAAYVTNDAIAKLLYDVKFSQIEGNSRKFSHIELSNIGSSVKFSNSVYCIQCTSNPISCLLVPLGALYTTIRWCKSILCRRHVGRIGQLVAREAARRS